MWRLAGVAQFLALLHVVDMGENVVACFLINHRTDVCRRQPRVAQTEFFRCAFQHVQQMIGDVLLHIKQTQCRAALTGGAEGGHHDVIADLFRQSRRVDDHRVDPARFGNERNDRATFCGQRAVDQPCGFGRPGKGYPCNGRMGRQRRTDIAFSREQVEDIFRDTGLIHQLGCFISDQRCLFRGLGDDGVARHQSCADLTEEDRQREVPGRNADEDAAATIAVAVFLACRSGHQLAFTEKVSGFGRVVSAEVDCLADFGNAIGQALAGFHGEDRHQTVPVGLQQVANLVDGSRPLFNRSARPFLEPLLGIFDSKAGRFAVREAHRADLGRAVHRGKHRIGVARRF